jgi:uncharacterized protein YbgA (DUF1722 family)
VTRLLQHSNDNNTRAQMMDVIEHYWIRNYPKCAVLMDLNAYVLNYQEELEDNREKETLQ